MELFVRDVFRNRRFMRHIKAEDKVQKPKMRCATWSPAGDASAWKVRLRIWG